MTKTETPTSPPPSQEVKPYKKGDQVLMFPLKDLGEKELKLKDHFIKVLSNTDAETVIMQSADICSILSVNDIKRHGLINWAVGTEHTTSRRVKPNSVLTRDQLTKEKGLAEVNRETLLLMLENVK